MLSFLPRPKELVFPVSYFHQKTRRITVTLLTSSQRDWKYTSWSTIKRSLTLFFQVLIPQEVDLLSIRVFLSYSVCLGSTTLPLLQKQDGFKWLDWTCCYSTPNDGLLMISFLLVPVAMNRYPHKMIWIMNQLKMFSLKMELWSYRRIVHGGAHNPLKIELSYRFEMFLSGWVW